MFCPTVQNAKTFKYYDVEKETSYILDPEIIKMFVIFCLKNDQPVLKVFAD